MVARLACQIIRRHLDVAGMAHRGDHEPVAREDGTLVLEPAERAVVLDHDEAVVATALEWREPWRMRPTIAAIVGVVVAIVAFLTGADDAVARLT